MPNRRKKKTLVTSRGVQSHPEEEESVVLPPEMGHNGGQMIESFYTYQNFLQILLSTTALAALLLLSADLFDPHPRRFRRLVHLFFALMTIGLGGLSPVNPYPRGISVFKILQGLLFLGWLLTLAPRQSGIKKAAALLILPGAVLPLVLPRWAGVIFPLALLAEAAADYRRRTRLPPEGRSALLWVLDTLRESLLIVDGEDRILTSRPLPFSPFPPRQGEKAREYFQRSLPEDSEGRRIIAEIEEALETGGRGEFPWQGGYYRYWVLESGAAKEGGRLLAILDLSELRRLISEKEETNRLLLTRRRILNRTTRLEESLARTEMEEKLYREITAIVQFQLKGLLEALNLAREEAPGVMQYRRALNQAEEAMTNIRTAVGKMPYPKETQHVH